ncbi:MAG: hypothetical protein R3C62_12720 [Chloroflexota bacterium]
MTVLSNYKQFSGTHWETGSVHNFLAARGRFLLCSPAPLLPCFFKQWS